ncbi:LTA synthase family protein [Hymenobacter sp. GOD-10R]|uniref:LTA synthase family protein n=1 Tax=Hymenobacter sp. GOD-10R TaxID=3093922 RepID=UPI002D76E120|nr:LTA synthase family protein [Hymenobacter sp. GOD-10R]WRQ30963.1 LTA synthase family protein [Hymenobacter sp. GOD-10R]
MPPYLLFAVGSLAGPRFPTDRLIRLYTALALLLVTLLTVTDLELYSAWGFRLDATPLQYLASPTEMAASAGSAPLLLLVVAFLGLLLLGWGLYQKIVGRFSDLPPTFGRGRAALVGLLEMLLLVVPLRGGVQQIPVNQSDVYFSSQPYANHAAINVPWNVANSLFLQNGGPNPYHFMADSMAKRTVRQLYTAAASAPDTATTRLIRQPRPNVLFIILESFTAKLVGSVGGETGVTPNLDSLARTGVLFTNFYASGDRSQKGLVSLLSGYPNQPTTSIIKYPRKTEHLPHLCQSLKAVGYSSHYYYGGELAFANMKSYLITAGYEKFTERTDFTPAQQNSKWGAHDHILFDRILKELPSQRQPFFVTAFTLSSHEPFDIPIPAKFPGTDEAAHFRNSVYYTDWALGRFLHEARTQPWWDNTLIVLVADHGHPLPNNDSNENPSKFHIPLIVAGGALRPEARGRVVTTYGAQTDLAATLLAQLQLPAQDYVWSHNLLQPVTKPFAFYCFNNGFGMVTPTGAVTFDNVARTMMWKAPDQVPNTQLVQGQAYEQASYADFLRK